MKLHNNGADESSYYIHNVNENKCVRLGNALNLKPEGKYVCPVCRVVIGHILKNDINNTMGISLEGIFLLSK